MDWTAFLLAAGADQHQQHKIMGLLFSAIYAIFQT